MRLSDAAVRRPVAMSCLIIALALLGLNAYRTMGLELMPKIDIPFITVVTVYPGATPAEIETDVAKRIEDAVVSVDGLKHVTSLCTENVCQTFLEFDLAVDVDITATDVREQIDLVRATLPTDVEDPQILKFDLNAQPIITLALTGDAPLAALYDFADNELKDRITTIPGVATVELIGGARREMHVLLDRERLAGRGLSSFDVVQAIRQGVVTVPAGRVHEAGNEINLTFDADVASAAELAELELAHGGDQRCRIRDVGRVAMRTAEQRQAARVDGRPAVAIRVVKKGDANAVRVTEAVRAAMGRLQRELPGGMDLVWVTDDGRFIEATNESAWSNVIQGILLTAAILFLFLYNLRSLLVVALTMPLTVVIGLFFMQMLGFTLNSSTLIAIGLSVGVLVTNSIVVLEAIIARLQAGRSPREAARLGADQAWIAVLASAGTNVVVLFPLAIMPSLIGLWIQPLAVTMFIMTVVSLFISFTLTPLLCSLLLRPADAGRRGLLVACERLWNRGLERVIGGYRRLLAGIHRRRWRAVLVLFAVLALLVHAMATAGSLGSSMVEEPDRGEVYVKLEFPTRYALERTRARVEEAVAQFADLPGLEHSLAMVGKIDAMEGQISEGVYLAQILLRFAHRTEREADIDELLAAVRDRLTDYPGAIITVSQPGMV
ncbi:MAG: efflux RND transporter permease subunit, partial [Planctomycetota bacterium]